LTWSVKKNPVACGFVKDLNLDDSLGPRLKRWREQRGWSQQVLADRVGVSQGKISDLETGANRPLLTPSQIAQFADVLGIPPAQFLGIEDVDDAYRPRIVEFLGVAEALTDSDIDALTIVARQLASARAGAAPSLTSGEQDDQQLLTEATARASRLQAAEEPETYDAGEPERDAGQRPRRGRSSRGNAGA
jgi:transcriptional regulator with XRE-family HTH domain